jgi:hypothetical protein
MHATRVYLRRIDTADRSRIVPARAHYRDPGQVMAGPCYLLPVTRRGASTRATVVYTFSYRFRCTEWFGKRNVPVHAADLLLATTVGRSVDFETTCTVRFARMWCASRLPRYRTMRPIATCACAVQCVLCV